MKNQTATCKKCNGSGLDKKHTWPDGSFASCEECEGYGEIAPHMNTLPESAQEPLRAMICEYSVRDILEFISDYMIELAEGGGEIGYEPDEQTLRDDAAIIAHAARHVRG